MSTSPKSKQERRRDRREERRLKREAELRAAQRRRTLLISGVVALFVIAAGIALFSLRGALASGNPSSANSTPTSSVDPTATAISSMPAVGLSAIQCNSMEQLTYHVHAHVSIYVNGQPAEIPAGVGIDQNQGCYYWLHTHDTSGVIHIEAPGPNNFELGTFFDLWKQKFSQLGYPQQLNQSSGWKVYVNGQPYNGDFRNISLTSHTLITLAYNSPNVKPDTEYNWDGL
ncbi:MAG TPA: hypothetical protein VH593_15785 [Ktedonobacteraceae bacterium]|jgi:hypothetical protein